MPTNLQIASFVLGAVLLLVALLGGNFKIFAAEIPGTAGTKIRWTAGIFGLIFIALAFAPPVFDHNPSPQIPKPSAASATRKNSPLNTPPLTTETSSKATEIKPEALIAMQWIESRCGPGIEMVVPGMPGSTIDRAARAIALALGDSGVRPVPLVTNYGGNFYEAGRFSPQKFDAWYRDHGVKEGCLLAIVPHDVGDQFAKPRVNVTSAGKTYGIVLPRGVVAEAADRWGTIFVKAGNDPDFRREIEKSGLLVDVIR